MNITLPILTLALLCSLSLAQVETPAEPTPAAPEDLNTLLIPTVTINPDVSTQIRVARTHTGQLLLPAVINGRDLGWWLLDTGSSDNVIDVRAAKELELTQTGTVVTRDFTGVEQTSNVFSDVAIVIGNCAIEQPRIAGVDMLPISTMVGQPVIGIIGCAALNQLVMEIDFLSPVVHIKDPNTFEAEGVEWLPVAFDNQSPVLEGVFEGNPGTFVLDTGLGLAVDFSRDTVTEFDMTEGRETRDWTSVGVGGRVDVQLGFIDSFEFLGNHYANLPAVFEDPQGFEGTFPDQNGMIGSLILRDFITTLDLGQARVALTPVERGEPAGDLFLADLVGTYRDRGTGGVMVIDWDGEQVTAILGAGQPQLEIKVYADGTFYFPAAWISGQFNLRDGVIMGIRMQLPDGQFKRALKMD